MKTRYYYNSETKEFAGTDAPVGGGFDYTMIEPPKEKNDDESLIFNGDRWDVVGRTEEIDLHQVLSDLNSKLNAVDVQISRLERIRDRSEEEESSLQSLYDDSTELYREIKSLEREIDS